MARVLREGVTLDAALKDALVAADPKLFSAVRSLSYGAVRGYFRHEAILGKAAVGSRCARWIFWCVRFCRWRCTNSRMSARRNMPSSMRRCMTAKATDAMRASGLINAVLRRYLRERKALDLEIARRPATRHAAPIWLADRFRADWPVRWTQLLAASDTQAPMWLRVNSRAGDRRRISRRAAQRGHLGARRGARALRHCLGLALRCA